MHSHEESRGRERERERDRERWCPVVGLLLSSNLQANRVQRLMADGIMDSVQVVMGSNVEKYRKNIRFARKCSFLSFMYDFAKFYTLSSSPSPSFSFFLSFSLSLSLIFIILLFFSNFAKSRKVYFCAFEWRYVFLHTSFGDRIFGAVSKIIQETTRYTCAFGINV